MTANPRPQRRSLYDLVRLLRMRRFSNSRRVDRLWLGCIRGDKATGALDRVEQALHLIKLHDPLRYRRITHDLERIWVDVLPGCRGEYHDRLRTCMLDERFVLATEPEQIASSIAHEATHARLLRSGTGYQEPIRARVEAACIRREIAFAPRLPNGAKAVAAAERDLAWLTPQHVTEEALFDRGFEGATEALRYLELPNGIPRTLLAVARAGDLGRRLLRSRSVWRDLRGGS